MSEQEAVERVYAAARMTDAATWHAILTDPVDLGGLQICEYLRWGITSDFLFEADACLRETEFGAEG